MSSSSNVNWKRFWCPRGGSYPLTGNGYLPNFDNEFYLGNSKFTTLEMLFDIPCLILLGEPGIGKSNEITKHSTFIEEKIRESGDEILLINMKSYTDKQELFEDIFKSPILTKWCKGENRLYLVLDSFDEALLDIKTLSFAIPDKIRSEKLPVERLYLRIASRVADWPNYLEEQLQLIWGQEKVSAYELLPLRELDVKEYAKANGINDSNTFIKDIEARDGQPFAIRPVTLKFLTKIYIDNNGDIPKSKLELYWKGCLYLCREESSSRIEASRVGKLSPEQKMKIAGRIAALSVFSNKASIWNGKFDDDAQENDLIKQSLYGGQEFINTASFDVNLNGINETLNTALFSSMGAERLGWSHRTYAEFLAAWYLIEHNFDEPKLLSLISHPGDINQRLIPQLQETAAWLATFSEKVFDALKDRNPEVLLRSDVILSNEAFRASLVNVLLTKHDSEELFELGWEDIYYYKRLAHADLANQVRDFMCDITKNIWTRKLAIEIALECNCTALLDELVVIALNVNDLSIIREHAAQAITEIGDKNAKLKLKTLLTNPENNLSDELRGYSFTANWPDNISATELFQLISPPKPDSIIGGKYWTFIHHSVARYLKLEDLPIALDWVFRVSEDNVIPDEGSYTNLIDEVMLLGWNNLEKPEILRPFTLATMARIKSHDGIFSRHTMLHLSDTEKLSEMIEKDEKKRHLLVVEMLSLLPPQESFDPCIMVFWPTPLIFPKDFKWLLNIYQTTSDVSQKSAIAHWIVRIYDSNNQDQTDVLYRLYVTDDIFKEKLGSVFGIVEFNSKQADDQKEFYKYQLERKEYAAQKLVPSLAERISNLLEKNENGDISTWWMLNLELTIDEGQDARHYGNEYERDITELPGWKISDNSIRERIQLAAKRYVIDGESHTQEFLEKDVLHRPLFAGYRALRLICKEDNQYLLKIDANVWQKWAAIISTYPTWGSKKSDECDDTLLIIANQYAFDEIKRAILISIKRENRKKDGVIELAHLKLIWSEKLEYILLRCVKFKSLKNNLFRSILWFLLQNNSQPAHDYIIGMVQSHTINDESWKREKIVIAIQYVVIYSNNPHWEIIWEALIADEKLADDVINGIASYHHSEQIFTFLSFNQLSDLYLFLLERYPPEEDPKSILNREKITEWRDGILNFMVNSGQPDGCVALRKLSNKLPKLKRLKYLIFKAEFNMRQKTWIPLNEKELLNLFLQQDAILIENEQQLLDTIIKSLRNLDKLLQGETPQAIFLWNEIGKKPYQYTPKDENRISDYVKIHLERELKEKGIVVNREVEIRRGEETDIRIEAIKKDKNSNVYDILTVIVETKGCWHHELDNAMKTQLKDRYLKDNQCKAGLYLIGWFNSEKWDSQDSRFRKMPKYSLSDAKIRFENQAKILSNEEILLKSYILDLSI